MTCVLSYGCEWGAINEAPEADLHCAMGHLLQARAWRYAFAYA